MYKQSEELSLLRNLMDNIKDNIYFMDRDGHIIMINQAGAEWLGFNSPEEVIGKTDLDIFTSEHGRAAFEDEQRIIETGVPILGLEEKETWADGHETWVSTSKMPLRDANGNIIGIFGISRDITEHQLSEIKLHQYARQLTQINKQMEDELRMAANLQHAFLPQFYPDFPAPSEKRPVQFAHRYIASTLISGDLCAVNKLNDTEAGLLIFDVMGHGVRAALVTAVVHTMIGELTHRGLRPGEFLSEMNRQLQTMLQTQDDFLFITANYLILNNETGSLSGASAGHTIPFIIPGGGNQNLVSMLHAVSHINGPALAVVENFEYKTFTVQLNPGDSILMYTDGLIEETNEAGEEFGSNRVQALLQQQRNNDPQTLCDTLVDTVSEFNKNAVLTDDICLLAFRWNGPLN